jgi:HEAT repeat protein
MPARFSLTVAVLVLSALADAEFPEERGSTQVLHRGRTFFRRGMASGADSSPLSKAARAWVPMPLGKLRCHSGNGGATPTPSDGQWHQNRGAGSEHGRDGLPRVSRQSLIAVKAGSTASLAPVSPVRRHGGEDSDDEPSDTEVVREIISALGDAKTINAKQKLLARLSSEAPVGSALAVQCLRRILGDKDQSIVVRRAALAALGRLGLQGDPRVGETLAACVERDGAHDVRHEAFRLLARKAAPRDPRAYALALLHLRKRDLPGEPLFKPNGDPQALTEPAIATISSVAARGDSEVWHLLLRRAAEASAGGVRVAAVRALARIADGDQIVDGGARGTVHLLANSLADEFPGVREAAIASLAELGQAQGGIYYG